MKAPIEAGHLLVATQGLVDPNFYHSVVLICRYSPDQGAVGLILNRPTELKVSQVLPELAETRGETLWVGGPVDVRSLWTVHRRADLKSLGEPVLDDLWFGSSARMIRRLLKTTAPDLEGVYFRLYVGYAGWGAGQLESEIEEGAWQVLPVLSSAILSSSNATLWGEMTLRSMIPLAHDQKAIRSVPWN